MIILMMLSVTGTIVAAKSANEIRDDLVKGHTKAFMQRNLVNTYFNEQNMKQWNDALEEIGKYLSDVLNKKRTMAISDKNKQLLAEQKKLLQMYTRRLLESINDFSSLLSTLINDSGKDAIAGRLAALKQDLQEFKDRQKELESSYTDFADTKEAKQLLKNAWILLEGAYIKVQKDWQEAASLHKKG